MRKRIRNRNQAVAVSPLGGKPSNLYADQGSIWQLQSAMNATAAGHMMRKLPKHLGEDRISWGTTALVVGQPAQQIASFIALAGDELANQPALVRAGEIPYRPHFGYGPRTRREFFAMLRDPSHLARG